MKTISINWSLPAWHFGANQMSKSRTYEKRAKAAGFGKYATFFPWLLSVLLTAGGLYGFFTSPVFENEAEIAGDISSYVIGGGISFIIFVLIPPVFSALGALIVTRRNGNRVGWLMLIFAFFVFIAALSLNPMDF